MSREWPTWLALIAVYTLWALATTWLAGVSVTLAVLAAGILGAFHSSLSHEALHGHPTANAYVNAGLVFPALSLFVPYLRFKDTHLAHHKDENLTDPYDDPETNFMDPLIWAGLPKLIRIILRINNTLAGRMLIGPIIAQVVFMKADARAIGKGDMRVLLGWALHMPSIALVILWANVVGEMPGWGYIPAGYLAISLLKIRTFLEHRAHEDCAARTVLIADRGPLALLFLNNNYHIVHHSNPRRAWYEMPGLYAANSAHYEALNGHYVYPSYLQVFRRYFLRAKDPVPHPLWPKAK